MAASRAPSTQPRVQYTTVPNGLNSAETSSSLPSPHRTLNTLDEELRAPLKSYKSHAPAQSQSKWSNIRISGFGSFFKRATSLRHNSTERHRYTGWRLGVYIGLYTSVFVLCINLSLLIWGIVHGGQGFDIGTITRGKVKSVSMTSIAYHVLINVLATVLLSASNFCMQVLSSPTRDEVDQAHFQGKRLDVGILSAYNLRYISWKRQLLWWIFFLSSFPLHLFYNSTISDVTSGRKYTISISPDVAYKSSLDPILGLHEWKTQAWYGAYDAQYVSEFADLQLYVDALSFGVGLDNETGAFSGFQDSPIAAMFNQKNQISIGMGQYRNYTTAGKNTSGYPTIEWPTIVVDPSRGKQIRDALLIDDDGWVEVQNYTFHVSNATSKIVDDGSKVQLALPYMTVIIICNVLKVVAMGYMLIVLKSELLVTVGDAVQSFLQHPDITTLGCCMLSEQDIYRKLGASSKSKAEKADTVTAVSALDQFGSEHGNVRHRRRMLTPLAIVVACGVIGPGILVISFLNKDNPGLGRYEWGTASQLTWNVGLARVDTSGILFNTWLSNMPQVLLSSAYFFTNRFLTQLASAVEWGHWSVYRKYLRVTKPEGLQRSTHFLQLPYRIAIPMMVYSGLLHWLLSQALFLRRLEIRDLNGSIMTESSMCTVGYSPISLLVFIIMTFVGGVVVLVQGWRLVPTGTIPRGANSSLIISAACHPPPDEVDPHLRPLKWGVVKNRFPDTTVQHCTFSSEEVEEPQAEKDYA